MASSSSSESNIAVISGMIGENNTYFADNPVVINVSELDFPEESPIKVCRVQVLYGNDSEVVGEFSGEVGSATSISFDISSALRALWSEYDFSNEVSKALLAENSYYSRSKKAYSLKVFTEYISDDGVFTVTDSGEFAGGSCIIGGLTEIERSVATGNDVSMLEHSGPRNGDASTKPTSSPERVGSNSITSWVDVNSAGTKSVFYSSTSIPQNDDTGEGQWNGHAPIVMRDSVPYTDFLFVNRRGAVETCSARMLEAQDIAIEAKQYAHIESPTYNPSRSIMAIASGGRRSWSMSSGYQIREWAEWWTLEFLMARRHWMLYNGKYVPVTVTPAKKTTNIYDRTKQQMPSVEFTVTLALEG